MAYKIGSFNLKNIGDSALKTNHDRNLSKIAEIIRNEQYDIVALQEVLSKGNAFTAVTEQNKKAILMELGGESAWGFTWAHAEGYSDRRNEGYAFIWNKKRIKLSTYERFTLFGIVKEEFKPQMIGTNYNLARKVYYGRFTPIALPKVEFRLLCIHTSPKTCKEELEIIMKQIYPKIEDERIKEHYNGSTSYTILMGDYNVQLMRDWKVQTDRFLQKSVKYLDADIDDIVVAEDWGAKRIITVQDDATTLPQKDPNEYYEPPGEGNYRDYVNDYDHFSYDVDSFEGINLKYNRVDAVIEYCFNDFDLYRDEISDHVPISLEIELNNRVDAINYYNKGFSLFRVDNSSDYILRNQEKDFNF